MAYRARGWWFGWIVLAACGRSELEFAADVRAGRAAPQAPAAAAAAKCSRPALPVDLGPACLDELCACDRAALEACDFMCWVKVTCRVATCNNFPKNRECSEGCAGSSRSELSLGRCYEASKSCLKLQPYLPP